MRIQRLILVSLMVIAFFTETALAVGDSKYYSEFVLKHKLSDKFDLFFTPEFRFKNDMGHMYYQSYRVGSTYHAYKYLDLAAAYRYVQTQDSAGDWSNNDTQYLEMIMTPKIKLAGLDLSDANKFEYRFIENARDRWFYRNLLTAAYPLKVFNFEFTPYISDEIYYDYEIEKINLNWLTLGVTKKLNKILTVGIYYRKEESRLGATSKWIANNILGTNIAVNF